MLQSGVYSEVHECINVMLSELKFCFSLFFLQEDGNRITWGNNPNPFTCVINAPEKKSKFKGMKSFIAYNITPSVSSQTWPAKLCLHHSKELHHNILSHF